MKPSYFGLSVAAAFCLTGASAAFSQQPVLDDETTRAIEAFLGTKLSDVISKQTDNLQLKYIEPNSPDDQPGWGIDYSWKASRESAPDAEPRDGQKFAINRLSYELAIDGSYVFNDAKNNQDLSTATAALKISRGDFGTLRVIPREESEAFKQCIKEIPAPQVEADIKLFDRAIDLCAQANGIDKRFENQGQRSYFYWLDFHGGVEANQDYSQTHTLFGLTAALAFQPDSNHAKYNIFDLPFSWLRNAFADSRNNGFVAPYPSLMLGIDRLDADAKDPRSSLTTDPTYNRVKAEVAFATQLANIGGQIVRLTTSYRYYKELSAPSAVTAADLDEFSFFTASLRFPARMLPLIESDAYELFVSYTDGKLPFGVANDQTFEVGISTNIDALAELLGK